MILQLQRLKARRRKEDLMQTQIDIVTVVPRQTMIPFSCVDQRLVSWGGTAGSVLRSEPSLVHDGAWSGA
jgi:hypothetical protein